jgi:hypothetical protein
MSRLMNFVLLQRFAENRGVPDPAAATRIGIIGFAIPSPAMALALGSVLINRELESQTPPAGATGASVSTSTVEFQVPEATGIKFAEAEKKLINHPGKFVGNRIPAVSDDSKVPVDNVIEQQPAAGRFHPQGGSVDLLVMPPRETGQDPRVAEALDKLSKDLDQLKSATQRA